MLLGLHLGHPQEVSEQIKMMPFRQAGEPREGFQNERYGLVRASILRQFVDPRPPTFVKRYALTLSRCLFQTTVPNPRVTQKYPHKGHNQKEVFCNSLDTKCVPENPISTSVDLTVATYTPMFGLARPTRVPRNRPHFFP